MLIQELSEIIVEQQAIASVHLNRLVIADFYLPKNIEDPSTLEVLLINDGQDLEEMPFQNILNRLIKDHQISPVICVGVHASKHRKQEYGTAHQLDYAGRGTKAKAYQQFLLKELLPFLFKTYSVSQDIPLSIAGFSLGGLSALDTAWYSDENFWKVGVFSGSLWWRSRELDKHYDDDLHRIMHRQIRETKAKPPLRFYFTTGSLDETEDRNNNGIIDSIDDTLDLIKELKNKGYADADIEYINYPDGKHDVGTWAKALPDFLRWGWAADGLNL